MTVRGPVDASGSNTSTSTNTMKVPANNEEELLDSVNSERAHQAPEPAPSGEADTHGIGQTLGVVLQNISDGFVALDREWRMIFINRRGQDMLRPRVAPGNELIGAPLWTACPALVGTPFEQSIRRAADKQRVVRFEHLHSGPNTWFDVRAHPSSAGVAVYLQDITGRKRSEHRLKSSFGEIEDLKAALDEHAIVAITDPKGKILSVNDKFCAISQYTREELIGRDHRIINSGHHSKEFIRELWATISEGRVWKGEIKNKAKDGSYYWVDTTIVPFLDDHGKPRQYVAIRADTTQRKRAEEEVHTFNLQLEQRIRDRTAQLEVANKELESFSYSVSHDLRAPLRHIGGFVNLLKQSAGDALPERSRGHLETIADSARQMGRLIDDLLVFSRMGRAALNKEPVDLEALLDETLQSLEPDLEERNVRWNRSPLPTVLGDRAMLRQVFTNLLANAIKYTRPRDPAVIEIGADHATPGEVNVHVRDNGVGFDMEYAAKLFGVFQRLHSDDEFEGTGIGLANVRRIIARHGGRTWAEGEVNNGATFHFSLPHSTNEHS